jgi:hypothetical protein
MSSDEFAAYVDRTIPKIDVLDFSNFATLSGSQATNFPTTGGEAFISAPGIHSVASLPDKTTVSVEVNEDGSWDRSTLAYHVAGAPDPTYINMSYSGEVSPDVYHPTVVGGENDGATLQAQESVTPDVFKDADGNPFIYVPSADRQTAVPVYVNAISKTQMEWRQDASLAADFVPVLGTAKLLGQIISGRDAYAGTEVSRTGQAAGAALSLLGGAVVSKVADKVVSRVASRAVESISTNSSQLRAIAAGVADLSHRQASVLTQLDGFGSRAIISKRGFGQSDVAALSAATGDEFAMFSTGGRRLLIRGNSSGVPIGLADGSAQGLAAQGWRWSSHVHPDGTLLSSAGDRAVLGAFENSRSAILTPSGTRGLFSSNGDLIGSGWLPGGY